MREESQKPKAKSQKPKISIFGFRFSVLHSAFSLVELMIAIMILGIGLTMVATVFPVGLDMTRETVQMEISQGAADAALATVQLKVPGLKTNLILPDNIASHRVLIADVYDIELTTGGPNGNPPPDAIIDNEEQEVLNPTYTPFPFNDWVTDWYGSYGTAPTQLRDRFIDRCRVYTERTGWDAEWDGTTGNAYVLPGQNLPADPPAGGYTNSQVMLVPIFSPQPRADMVRVHLADSIYPPIGVDMAIPTFDTNDPNYNANDVKSFFQTLTERKYSWTVIHHLISSNGDSREMMLTIVVTHRGEQNSRYARQLDQRTLPAPPPNLLLHFDLNQLNTGNPDDPLNSMALPQPDVAAEDAIFPQPWLVLLSSVNTNTGQVQCTTEVARLLPAGSFFIVAQTQGSLWAGTSQKVLTSSWNVADIPTPDPVAGPFKGILQIKKAESVGTTANNVPVWVFPPAIEVRDNSNPKNTHFVPRCPVVGVALRGVPVQ